MMKEKAERKEVSSKDKICTWSVRRDVRLLSNDDLFLFNEGSNYRLYEKLGAHPLTVDGVEGTYFAVWAPNAKQVSVIGDFNSWDKSGHLLCQMGNPVSGKDLSLGWVKAQSINITSSLIIVAIVWRKPTHSPFIVKHLPKQVLLSGI
jgi:hypothetical protein